MATLLDQAQQGDVATVSDDSKISSSVKLMSPQELYGVPMPGAAAVPA